MIIKQSSWHYRMMEKMDMNIPKSLCPYFWKTVFCVLMLIFIVVMLSFVFISSGALILGYATPVGLPLLTSAISFVVGLVSWVVGIASVFGITWGVLTIKDRRQDKKDKEEYLRQVGKLPPLPPKKKYVVIEYIKAVKGKVCPILEFK